MIHVLESQIIAAINHPVWLMDENAIILRRDVWLRPPTEPTITEMMIINEMRATGDVVVYLIKVSGANFCHVMRIKQSNHVMPSITSGIHMWNGAPPSLIDIAKIQTVIDSCIDETLSVITANKNSEEAITWTIKYFKAASAIRWLLVFEISGIKDRRLISSPIQVPYQEVDDTEIKVPLIKVRENNRVLGLVSTRKRRFIIIFICGVWAH